MALTGNHTYVGFGFGAIQAGLFLYEAFQSGNFGRLVVAEIVPDVVAEIREAGGCYSINIAHADRVETVQIGPIDIYNPAVAADRGELFAAIGEAQEIGTAIPRVDLYATDGPGSLHRVLADGLAHQVARGCPQAVVYAAENNNTAAEQLRKLVLREMPRALDDVGCDKNLKERHLLHVRFLNTVIGKMSGLADAPDARGLATITRGSQRAFLVEAFNRILISRIDLDEPFERGIAVFIEKDDLLPFEEAKLYGHNATHALAAYLAAQLGIEKMADLRPVPGFVPFLRDAFLRESGEALIRKHNGVDRLFTPEGYSDYADDLLDRMTNPFLMDTVERVGRDPERKLGWDDRLIGTMRLALSQGIEPRRYAIGAAAALAALDAGFLDGRVSPDTLADPIWQTDSPERQTVLAMIEEGGRRLRGWRDAGFPDLRRIVE